MLDLERSQIAELLKEQNALLRDIKKLNEPLTLDRLTAAEKEEAFQVRLLTASLGECFALEANKRNLTIDQFNRVFCTPRNESNETTFDEILSKGQRLK